MSEKILTFLIPTFNRSGFLSGLLHNLITEINKNSQGHFEIIVSDNCSTDNTYYIVNKYIQNYKNIDIKYVKTLQHYQSGEENLFSALKHCVGKYVWVLCDDDYVCDGAVSLLVQYLYTGKYTVINIVPRLVTLLGESYKQYDNVESMGLADEEKFLFAMRKMGILSTNACFGAKVFLRDKLLACNFGKYINVSPTYSHLFVLLESFSEDVVLNIKSTLFDHKYEGVEATEARFKQYTTTAGVCAKYHLTVGICRLFSVAISVNCISEQFFFEIEEIDSELDGRKYLLAERILAFVCDQISVWLTQRIPDELILKDDMDFLVDFYSKGGQKYLGIITKLQRLMEICTYCSLLKNRIDKSGVANYLVADIDDRFSLEVIEQISYSRLTDNVFEDLIEYVKRELAVIRAVVERLLSRQNNAGTKALINQYCRDIIAGYFDCLIRSKKNVVLWSYNDICNALLSEFPGLVNNISAIVDSNPNKHGMMIDKTTLRVESPNSKINDSVDTVIICSKDYADEIINELKNIYNYSNEIIAVKNASSFDYSEN